MPVNARTLPAAVRAAVLTSAATTLAAALLGAWPTWALAGAPGVAALALAWAIALGVTAGAALLVSMAGTPERLAHAYVVAGMVRALVAAGIAGLCAWLLALPAAPLLLWTAVLYVVAISADGACICRTLRGPRT